MRNRSFRGLIGALVLAALSLLASALVCPAHAGGVVGTGSPGKLHGRCVHYSPHWRGQCHLQLQALPAANVDINQEYDLTMDTQTAVVQSGVKLYLPLEWK